MTATRRILLGLRNNVQKPNRNRSKTDKLGARLRDRLMTTSCCFMSRLSATIPRVPSGPSSLAIVVSRRKSSTAIAFSCFHGPLRSEYSSGNPPNFSRKFPTRYSVRTDSNFCHHPSSSSPYRSLALAGLSARVARPINYKRDTFWMDIRSTSSVGTDST